MTAFFRRATTLIIAMFTLLILAVPVLAQDVTPPDPTNLAGVADYLATGGAAVVAAIVLSYLSSKVPAFAALDSTVKWAVQVGLSAALGLGAWYLVTYQPALIAQLSDVFKALILAVLPAFANQIWHAGQKSTAPKA